MVNNNTFLSNNIIDKMVQTVNDRNQKELERVLEKEMNYDKAMGTYKVLEEDLYDKTSTYVDDYGGISYSGNNVDLGSHVGYVTKHGVFKHYPNKRVFEKTAGRNGCPSVVASKLKLKIVVNTIEKALLFLVILI